MRFDTPIYFQLVQRGAYNENTGDYGEDTIAEYKRYAAVSSTGINTLKLMYGEIKEGCLTVRLQRPYKEIFDRIRIGDKLYKVDTQKPLKDKTVFIVSEVQGSYTGTAGDGSIEYQKGYNAGLEQGYKDGYESGFNSAPPDYLPCVTTLKMPDWNVFGRKEVVLNIPLVTSYQSFMAQATQNITVEYLTINGAMGGTITTAYNSFGTTLKNIDNTLKRLTLNCDLSNAKSSYTNIFTYLAALEVIDGEPINFSSATAIGNLGHQLYALKDMRVAPLSIKLSIAINASSELTPETRQSIIDGLADLTGGTSQIISLHSTVLAKLTIEQLDQITAKNWLYG